MVVDYERAWLELKRHVVSKKSHGQRDLLRVMAETELKYEVEESVRGYDPTPTPKNGHASSVRS